MPEEAMKQAEARHYDEPVSFQAAERIAEDPQQMLRNHHIVIRTLHQGCVVEVGCKAFAFSSLEEGIDEVKAYTEDPLGVAKKYGV